MEGLFFLLFVGFIIYLAMNTSSKATTTSKKHLNPKASNNYEVPDYLKNKWDNENNNSRQSSMKNMKSASTTQNLWKTTKNTSESLQRQSRNAQDRNKAQKAMFSQSGTGQPVDKNMHRRADWGKRGHLGGGWLQPILVSLISAAAIAGLLAAT